MALFNLQKSTLLCLFLLLRAISVDSCSPGDCQPTCPNFSLDCTLPKCIPDKCNYKCCVNNACATNSSDCELSLSTLLIICLPIVVIVTASTFAICLKIVRRNHGRNQQVRPDGLQIAQGQPVQQQRNGNFRGLKIAPINTVEIETSSPVHQQSMLTPTITSQLELRAVEIDHGEFERKMIEHNNSPLMKRRIKLQVTKGVSVVLNDVGQEEDQSPFHVQR